MSRRAVILGLVVGASWAVTSAPPAEAHASLRLSDPADGAIVEIAPSEVTLTFTEPPDPKLTVVHVLNSLGTRVETGAPEPVPGRRFEVRAPLGTLPDGVYTVTWRTVSETDGHVTAGGFSFGVGVSPAGARPPPGGQIAEAPSPSALSIAGKWSLYVGLSLLLAAGTTGIVAFGGLLPRRRPLLITASALAAGGIVAMIVAERSAVGVPIGDLLSSNAGRRLVWLATATAAASVAGLVAASRAGMITSIVAGSAAAFAMLVRAIGGHASGQDLAWMNVGVQWIHLLGVGIWIGGLPWLLLVVRADDAQERAAGVRRFSRLAAVGLAAVAVTGVLRALNELGGWSGVLAAFDSGYGTVLAIKVVVALVLIALGAVNHYVNVPRYAATGGTRLRRTVGGELLLAGGIFALTGTLTGLPPPSGMRDEMNAPRPLVVIGNDFATTTRLRLEVTPGTIGPNRFVAVVTDYDTGEPVHADRVTLDFSLPRDPDVGSSVRLDHQADGTWAAQSTALAIVGDWDVTALVQETAGSTEIRLQIRPRVSPPHIEVSREPGQPDLYTITFTSGVQIQTYVDPGSPGPNQLHVTAFDAAGEELPLERAHVKASGPHGSVPLDMMRFGPGHFVANTHIISGTWSFLVDVTARDGSQLSVRFEETFEA